MAQTFRLTAVDADTRKIEFSMDREDSDRLAVEAEAFKSVVWGAAEIVSVGFGKSMKELLHSKVPEAVVSTVVSFGFSEPDIQIWGDQLTGWKTEPEIDSYLPTGWEMIGEATTEAEIAPEKPPALEAFETEKKALLEMKDDLITHEAFRGRFVAIYRGKVVGTDDDIKELARKTYEEYGYVPIYMGKVQKEERVTELPSPER
jgi:hypothetical protein